MKVTSTSGSVVYLLLTEAMLVLLVVLSGKGFTLNALH